MSALSSLPWQEKYRPQKLSDVVAHVEIIKTLSKMMENGDLPHLLLYGPPGTGKTSTILALARHVPGSEVLELNASDDRGIEVVRSRIKEFVSTKKLSFHKTQNSKGLKLVMLDESDALTLPAQMALRRIIEQYSHGTRFCLIANYIHKLIPALLSRCMRFRFMPLPDRFIAERLRYVANKEQLTIESGALAALLRVASGDMRQAINTLQSTRLAQSLQTSATATSVSVISDVAVFASASVPSPQSCAALYKTLRDPVSLYTTLTRALNHEITNEGHSLVDLIKSIHDLVLADAIAKRWSPAAFTLVLQQLAAVEQRLAIGASPSIQLHAVAAAFILARSL